jgi:hypothetical protein
MFFHYWKELLSCKFVKNIYNLYEKIIRIEAVLGSKVRVGSIGLGNDVIVKFLIIEQNRFFDHAQREPSLLLKQNKPYTY